MATTADTAGSGKARGRGFLGDALLWTVPVAVLAAAVGWAVTRDLRFPLSCLAGAAVDLATIAPIISRNDPGDSGGGAAAVTVLLFARLGVKAVLLVAASLLPRFLSLPGMAVGVLAYDTTLITVGAYLSANRAFGRRPPAAVESRREGRREGR